jgi:cell division septum initiation protein DivIVA
MNNFPTPEQIESPELHHSPMGYAKAEVHEHLALAADTIRYFQEIADTAYQRVGEEIGDILQGAHDHANQLKRAAAQEAAGIAEDARLTAARLKQDSEKEAAITLSDAKNEATRLRRQSEQEANSLTSKAEKAAARVVKDAEREAKRIKDKTNKEVAAITGRAEQKVAELRKLEVQARKRLNSLNLKIQSISEQLRSTQSDDETVVSLETKTTAAATKEGRESNTVRLPTKESQPK